jgi:hypothetical protein
MPSLVFRLWDEGKKTAIEYHKCELVNYDGSEREIVSFGPLSRLARGNDPKELFKEMSVIRDTSLAARGKKVYWVHLQDYSGALVFRYALRAVAEVFDQDLTNDLNQKISHYLIGEEGERKPRGAAGNERHAEIEGKIEIYKTADGVYRLAGDNISATSRQSWGGGIRLWDTKRDTGSFDIPLMIQSNRWVIAAGLETTSDSSSRNVNPDKVGEEAAGEYIGSFNKITDNYAAEFGGHRVTLDLEAIFNDVIGGLFGHNGVLWGKVGADHSGAAPDSHLPDALPNKTEL